MKSSESTEKTSTEATETESTDTTHSSNSSTQQPFSPPPFTAPPFGPFPPFNMQFPPPPFIPPNMVPGTGRAGNTEQVARFPLPFVSPFYPMAMPPQGFGLGMPPMMHGMPSPPWQRNMMLSQPQSSTSPPSTELTRETTERGASQAAPGASAQTSGDIHTTNESSTNLDNEAETIGTQDSSQENNQEGLRQRTIHRPRRSQSSARTEPRSAELPPRTRNLASDIAVLAFAFFVIGVIMLLVLRRLHMMNLLPDIL